MEYFIKRKRPVRQRETPVIGSSRLELHSFWILYGNLLSRNYNDIILPHEHLGYTLSVSFKILSLKRLVQSLYPLDLYLS